MPRNFHPTVLVRDPTDGREDLDSYRARGGWDALTLARREIGPADLCERVANADLRGRGGAAFPTGRKWELARAAAGSSKHVVANGGEHEPGSRKDQVLLATHPHTVLEGMALAAHATGASRGWLYVIEDMEPAIEAARSAIAEAEAAEYIGEAAGFEVELTLAPTSYVAGEETAALEVIEGREALPRDKPPFPGEQGVEGQPTSVNNVETLAHVPGIVRNGADWFRALGAPGSAGTMLFTLPDAVHRPGVYELPFGATFRDLIEGCGGGLRSGSALKAILPALSCAFLPASAIDLSLDRESLAEAGSTLGCGGISLLEEGQSLVPRCREIADFFLAEQCGQCAPCRMETSTLAAIMKKLDEGEPAGDYASQAGRIAGFTRGKGKCSLIEMAATPILSALRLFPDDFAEAAARAPSEDDD